MSVIRRNNVHVSGTGADTVVLSHGFGVDQSAWKRVLPQLERRYRVVRYDLTGLGQSDKAAYDGERHGTLHGHASDLLEICAELKLEGARFVGHSAGAMAGLLAAIERPTLFRKMVLLAISPHYIDEPHYIGGFGREQIAGVFDAVARDYVAFCDAMVPAAIGPDVDPAVTDELLHTFKRTDPNIAHHFSKVVFLSDHRADLTKLRVPALVVQASQDTFVPVQVGRWVAAQLPQGEFHLLQGRGGHFPHLAAPDDVVKVVNEYFARPT
jgi:sigma-B regulation protein RsbQ